MSGNPDRAPLDPILFRRKSDGAVRTPEEMLTWFEEWIGRELTDDERTLLLAETEMIHFERTARDGR